MLFTIYVSDMTEVKGKYPPETQGYTDDYQAYDFREIHFTIPTDWHGLTLISAWISNYTHYKMWDEITYPFLNVNGATVEV